MPTRHPHVVAVVPDSVEAVAIARSAAQIAVELDQPLALAVPAPVRGFTALQADTVVVATGSPLRTELALPVQVLWPATIEPVGAAEQPPVNGESLVAPDGAR